MTSFNPSKPYGKLTWQIPLSASSSGAVLLYPSSVMRSVRKQVMSSQTYDKCTVKFATCGSKALNMDTPCR